MTGAIATLPQRCSLYQALLWVVEQIPPIENLIFDSLPPRWVVIEDKHKRELLVALKLGTLRAQGDLWDLRGPRFRLENECADISPLMRALLDPNTAPLRALSREDREL